MTTHFDSHKVIGVITTQPIAQVLDYRAPEGGCDIGAFVEVPLGPRKVLGVVWGEGEGEYDPTKLRTVIRVLNVAPMRDEMRQFLLRAGGYTLTPLNTMLRLATRAPGLTDTPSMRKIYRFGTGEVPRATAARSKVLEVLKEFGNLSFTLTELAEQAGVSPSVIKGLVPSGAVLEQDTPRDSPYPSLDATRPGKCLTPQQASAARALCEDTRAHEYSTTLLRGITGSGKTEVYLEAVQTCLSMGRQALVLLPEIALTSSFVDRVRDRFGARPAEWHSGVTMTERRRCWRMVGMGGASLVVGARSALFLPFRDLGLVVVDEEHDSSYKQEDGALYHARDLAVLRASLNSAKVVLVSATPSLETWVNAQSGKYARLDLTERIGSAVLPQISAVDMRDQELPAGHWISTDLQTEIRQRIEIGEQSLLFLNRRGFAPVTICRACGHQIGCDHCDARMVEHRFLKRLMCHQCGDTQPIPTACPNCGVEGRLAPIGPGVERLAEEALALFPDSRIEVLSSDLFRSTRAMKAQLEKIADGGADIIIGTQMVAKGHNFPLLTLVGVIDADLGLQGSDLRAAERTYQLMRQVAGRAGRAERSGLALLQTYQPEHPVMRAILSGDDEAFWQAEAAQRREAGVPPFGRMAGLILSGSDLAQVFALGENLVQNADPLYRIGAALYGPAPAPIARVKGRHRVRLLVKATKSAPLQAALREWLGNIKLRGDLRLSVDIDPQSFL